MDRRNHFPFSRYCGLTSFHAADTVRLYTPAAYARVICRPLIFFVVVAVAVSFSFIKHSASLTAMLPTGVLFGSLPSLADPAFTNGGRGSRRRRR